MSVHVNYGPQNEEQETLYNNVQEYKNGNTNKSYYDNLFQGTPYEEQYNAILRKYQTVSLPNSFVGWLTGRDETNRYNHEISLMDELESLATKMYDEEYQSPSSEFARQRAAGLNPDLIGLTGQSAPQKQGGNIPSVSAENPLEVMSNTLSTVMQIYSTIKGFKGINLANEGKELSNLSSMIDFVKPTLIDSYAQGFVTGENRGIYNPFKNRRLARLFDEASYHLQSGGSFQVAEKAYERLLGLESNRWNYGSYVGNPNWSPDDSALYHYVGGLMHEHLVSQSSKYRFDATYWDSLSPKLKAGFENSQYDTERFLNRIRLNNARSLENDYKNGSVLAGLLLLSREGYQMPKLTDIMTKNIDSFGMSLK